MKKGKKTGMKPETKAFSKAFAVGMILFLIIMTLVSTCSCTPKRLVEYRGVILEELPVTKRVTRHGDTTYMHNYVVREYYPEHNPEKQLINRFGADIHNVGDTLAWHRREEIHE